MQPHPAAASKPLARSGCLDCAHAQLPSGATPEQAYYELRCLHPGARNPVTGKPPKCEHARSVDADCGRDGALFAPRVYAFLSAELTQINAQGLKSLRQQAPRGSSLRFIENAPWRGNDAAPDFEARCVPAPPDWPFGELTQEQRLNKAKQEARMRANALRGLPSCFGDLA